MVLKLHAGQLRLKNFINIILQTLRYVKYQRETSSSNLPKLLGTYFASIGFSAKSYARIIGANDRVRLHMVQFYQYIN
jgi:hypothetical protein